MESQDDFEETRGQISAKEEKSFPDDLEGKLNAVLNVVNTEFKSITLLHLDDKPIEGTEIKSRIRQTIHKGYIPSSDCFNAYCSYTLFPIGMVAREQVIRDEGDTESIGYSLTSAGRKYGLPIAALSIKYAAQNDVSLFDILGSTASSGEIRAPLARFKILKRLIEGSASEAELLKNIFPGISNGAIYQHLTSLEEKGLIYFDSLGQPSATNFKPTKKEGSPSPFRHMVSATGEAIRLLRESEALTSAELASLLKHERTSDASNILNSLVNEGYAFRSTESPGFGGVRTKASLTEAGKRFATAYLARLEDSLKDSVALEELNIECRSLVEDPETFAGIAHKAMNLYRKVSPRLNNRKSGEQIRGEILEYLTKHPRARPMEISAGIGSRADNYLNQLLNSNKIKKERTGHTVVYDLI